MHTPTFRDARSEQAGDLFRRAFAGAAQRLIGSDAGLRRPTDDPEPVHRARVAVRRMRSHLRAFGPILKRDWARKLSERLRWWGDALGAARDADVLLHALQARGDTLPAAGRPQIDALLATFAAQRAAAYARIASDLRDPRYLPLLEAILDAAKHPAFTARAATPAAEIVPELLGTSWRNLSGAVRRSSCPPTDDELHQIRIHAKRVRYVAEAVASRESGPAQQFARSVEALQTVLGEQHDAVVAAEKLRELGARGGLAIAAAELATLTRSAADEGRRTWRAAWRDARNHRFW